MIKSKTIYFDEDGFKFTFEPIEDTLTIKETEDGFEARYLIQDECMDSPDEWGDEELFLVHYHRNFWVEREKIITQNEVEAIYRGEKTEIEKEYHVFPVSAYIHGGVFLSLNDSFWCDAQGWDTSHAGLALISKKEIRYKKKALELAQGLVETWNIYLSGNVYCLVMETYDKEKTTLEYNILGGVYGYDCAAEELKTEWC